MRTVTFGMNNFLYLQPTGTPYPAYGNACLPADLTSSVTGGAIIYRFQESTSGGATPHLVDFGQGTENFYVIDTTTPGSEALLYWVSNTPSIINYQIDTMSSNANGQWYSDNSDVTLSNTQQDNSITINNLGIPIDQHFIWDTTIQGFIPS